MFAGAYTGTPPIEHFEDLASNDFKVSRPRHRRYAGGAVFCTPRRIGNRFRPLLSSMRTKTMETLTKVKEFGG